MPHDETDPIDELRHALWGDVDEGTRRVARKIGQQGEDGPVAERVKTHRRMKEVLERVRASRTPEDLRAWAMKAAAEKVAAARPAPEPDPLPEFEITWMTATPYTAAGVRGGADRLLVCGFKGWDLRASIHVDDGGSECGVNGKLTGQARTALAGFPVTFYVDRKPAESTLTDAFGEFAFDARPGTHFGVRVGDGKDAVYVAVADLAAEAPGAGALR